jgi:hypothetical protein
MEMIRTILSLGVFAMVGLFALGFVFKIFAGFIALVVWLLVLAVKVALVGGVAYVILRVVSPGTARRLRAGFSGDGGV